jgi:hypothetical protein
MGRFIEEIADGFFIKEIADDFFVKEIAKDFFIKEITNDFFAKEIADDFFERRRRSASGNPSVRVAAGAEEGRDAESFLSNPPTAKWQLACRKETLAAGRPARARSHARGLLPQYPP